MSIKQRNAKAAEIPPQTLTDEFSLTMPRKHMLQGHVRRPPEFLTIGENHGFRLRIQAATTLSQPSWIAARVVLWISRSFSESRVCPLTDDDAPKMLRDA
jgi:hypothetical protein